MFVGQGLKYVLPNVGDSVLALVLEALSAELARWGRNTMPSSEKTLFTAGSVFCSCAKFEESSKIFPFSFKCSLTLETWRALCPSLELYNCSRKLSSIFGFGREVSSSKDWAYQFFTFTVDGIFESPSGAFSRSLTFNAKRMGSSSTMNWEARKIDPGDGEGPNCTICLILIDVCGYDAYFKIFSRSCLVNSQPVPIFMLYDSLFRPRTPSFL